MRGSCRRPGTWPRGVLACLARDSDGMSLALSPGRSSLPRDAPSSPLQPCPQINTGPGGVAASRPSQDTSCVAGPNKAEHLLWEQISFHGVESGGNANPKGARGAVRAGAPQGWSLPTSLGTCPQARPLSWSRSSS